MVIFVYGKDVYRSSLYLKKVVDKFRADRDPSGYNTIVLDCADPKEAQRSLQEVLAAPFLAERRMVVLKHLISCKDEALKKQFLERFESGNLPDSNVIVVYETVDKYRSKLDKTLLATLEKEKYKEYFGQLEGRELASWASQEIKERGGSIDGQALSYLMANAGSNLFELINIIEQLVSYNPKVTKETVDIFVPEKIDDNIFTLVDTIVAGDIKKSFKLIQGQYDAGNDAGYMFAMILRQFRILIQLRDCLDRGVQPDPKPMSLHPFVVKKTTPIAQKYTMEKLEKAYNELLQMDVHTKLGITPQPLMLDMFLVHPK